MYRSEVRTQWKGWDGMDQNMRVRYMSALERLRLDYSEGRQGETLAEKDRPIRQRRSKPKWKRRGDIPT